MERLLGVKPSDKRSVVALGGTLLLVMLGWVMFRSLDVHSAVDMYRGLSGFNGFDIQPDIAWQIKNFALASLAVGVAVVFIEPWFNRTFPVRAIDPYAASSVDCGRGFGGNGHCLFFWHDFDIEADGRQ
ncbi:hypothetical protein [Rhizobium sp. AN95]|uniref:hypothetical protein n=1 Tax=Rhizobium sp. AN95 TaxID=3035216 RepID=UPI002B25D275|nr:hypothetical protein [Rhizobium sp. AN95]